MITKPEEKKLSRAEQRYQERVKAEVESTYKTLTVRFLDYFTSSDDPEGQAVQDKARQIAAQWRLYCSRKKLIPTLYPIVDAYINDLMKEYLNEKDSAPVTLDATSKDGGGVQITAEAKP